MTQAGQGHQFIAAAGLQDDEPWLQEVKTLRQVVQTGGVIGHLENFPGWPDGNIQAFFGDIDANKYRRRCHVPVASLSCRCGLKALATVRA